MNIPVSLALFAVIAAILQAPTNARDPAPDNNLRVMIIRHGEKSLTGDNLSCQGENRALLLPGVLLRKFSVPNYIYVPSIRQKMSESHGRMLETIIPLAVKYDLSINSEYAQDAYTDIAAQVLHKSGIVLMVWEHDAIPPLAAALGVINPPAWKSKNFDGIWVITYNDGKASLSIDQQGLVPPLECRY